MTVEAINAQVGSSIFGQPLNQFNTMDQIGHVVSVKHLYQVGAASCWYFIGEFLSGRTHNPSDIFNQTEKEIHRRELDHSQHFTELQLLWGATYHHALCMGPDQKPCDH